MGDGKTSPYPIAMSLATTFFSAITILSTPVEFARYGTMFAYMVFGWLILITLSVEIFAPMFQRMQLTSIYEYLGGVRHLIQQIILVMRSAWKSVLVLVKPYQKFDLVAQWNILLLLNILFKILFIWEWLFIYQLLQLRQPRTLTDGLECGWLELSAFFTRLSADSKLVQKSMINNYIL